LLPEDEVIKEHITFSFFIIELRNSSISFFAFKDFIAKNVYEFNQFDIMTKIKLYNIFLGGDIHLFNLSLTKFKLSLLENLVRPPVSADILKYFSLF
jgi:hypothetical protein